MSSAQPLREILTPEQAAAYLQVNRDTIYRYIREGKLMASRLGRKYRIPRTSLEQLLDDTRARGEIVLRTYTRQQIAGFLRDDTLDEEAEGIARRFAHEHGIPRKE
jgi:excisionase family DNA binding protein